MHSASIWELFPRDKLVVLSPDAEVDLDEVVEDCIYVHHVALHSVLNMHLSLFCTSVDVVA